MICREKVLIKGAGDLASGIALRLHRCGFSVMMTEIAVPTTVRRTVAFSPAVYLGEVTVEDVTARRCDSLEEAEAVLLQGHIAVVVDEEAQITKQWKPDVVVDAILAKANLGTRITDAKTVIGVGPGFTAGVDCHCVVETKRGHYLGRCIWKGSAIPNTGVPGIIGGYGIERLIRAEADGVFRGCVHIGDQVKAGQVVGYSGETPVCAQIDGVVRGLLQDGVPVKKGMKSGDVDPRCEVSHCYTVSDKATSIGGGVLEGILMHRNRRNVVLVLLAAGDSLRFRGNKLLTDFHGKPLYRHLADEIAELPEAMFYRRIVVSQYPEILNRLGKEGYETIENRESTLGISHSIGLALRQMDGREDAVCFAVCDQPYLRKETIADLVNGWKNSGKGMACVCTKDRDGNPTIFSRKYEPALLGLCGDVGGKQVMKRFPDDVFRLEIVQELELEDIDERTDMQKK